ncbi:MAG: DsbA family protein [Alphaproteobacteria bacterium]|nr:DsbA family protein [Alphaproteobacteria bacterium]
MTICNEELGCVVPQQLKETTSATPTNTEAHIIFVTDPICSHCWAIEPVWRRLVLNYNIKVRYIHGGLLPGWKDFGDAGNGISKPTDVIPHWIHVAQYYQQPIDPSVWKNDPIENSYILCKAAIAVRVLAANLESAFVRAMREQIFLHAINVVKEAELNKCLESLYIDTDSILTTLNSEAVNKIFEQDRQEMINLGARGFPSLIFNSQKSTIISGSQPYPHIEQALLQNFGDAISLRDLPTTDKLASYKSWTLREACEVLQVNELEARQRLIAHGFIKIKLAGNEFWQKD